MRKGFTLIELIMVIVIIGILAATALPRFIDLSGQATKAAAQASLANIRTAVAMAYAENAANGSATFPATITAAMFQDNVVPTEPYSKSNAITLSAVAPADNLGVGWRYDAASGKVWINQLQYVAY